MALALGAWQFSKLEPNRQNLLKIARELTRDPFATEPRYRFPTW